MPKKATPTVAEQVTEQLADAEMLTIKEIRMMTGLTDVYVRHAIKHGKLEVVKSTIPGRNTPINLITRKSFDEWRASVGQKAGARADGRNKYVLYMTPDEAIDAIQRIEGTSYSETLKRANIKAVADEA